MQKLPKYRFNVQNKNIITQSESRCQSNRQKFGLKYISEIEPSRRGRACDELTTPGLFLVENLWRLVIDK